MRLHKSVIQSPVTAEGDDVGKFCGSFFSRSGITPSKICSQRGFSRYDLCKLLQKQYMRQKKDLVFKYVFGFFPVVIFFGFFFVFFVKFFDFQP